MQMPWRRRGTSAASMHFVNVRGDKSRPNGRTDTGKLWPRKWNSGTLVVLCSMAPLSSRASNSCFNKCTCSSFTEEETTPFKRRGWCANCILKPLSTVLSTHGEKFGSSFHAASFSETGTSFDTPLCWGDVRCLVSRNVAGGKRM